jgi:hypothetical protein
MSICCRSSVLVVTRTFFFAHTRFRDCFMHGWSKQSCETCSTVSASHSDASWTAMGAVHASTTYIVLESWPSTILQIDLLKFRRQCVHPVPHRDIATYKRQRIKYHTKEQVSYKGASIIQRSKYHTKEQVSSRLCMSGARLDPKGVPGYPRDVPCGNLHVKAEVDTHSTLHYQCHLVNLVLTVRTMNTADPFQILRSRHCGEYIRWAYLHMKLWTSRQHLWSSRAFRRS